MNVHRTHYTRIWGVEEGDHTINKKIKQYIDGWFIEKRFKGLKKKIISTTFFLRPLTEPYSVLDTMRPLCAYNSQAWNSRITITRCCLFIINAYYDNNDLTYITRTPLANGNNVSVWRRRSYYLYVYTIAIDSSGRGLVKWFCRSAFKWAKRSSRMHNAYRERPLATIKWQYHYY